MRPFPVPIMLSESPNLELVADRVYVPISSLLTGLIFSRGYPNSDLVVLLMTTLSLCHSKSLGNGNASLWFWLRSTLTPSPSIALNCLLVLSNGGAAKL